MEQSFLGGRGQGLCRSPVLPRNPSLGPRRHALRRSHRRNLNRGPYHRDPHRSHSPNLDPHRHVLHRNRSPNRGLHHHGQFPNLTPVPARDLYRGPCPTLDQSLDQGASLSLEPMIHRRRQTKGRLTSCGYRRRGGGLEESVVLAGPTPITVAQGIAGLEALKGQLTRRQLRERAEPFRRAERFIRNAPAGGGVGPPGRSFALPRSDIRVDVEILRGVNFRD